MAQAKRRVVKEKPQSQSRGQQPFKAILYQISRLTTEVLFVISVIVGLLLLAALISYSDTDPAYTHVSTETEPKNWLGTFGAYLADILFFVFGWVAYLLPIIIWVWGRVASKSDKGGLFDLEAFLFRTLGGIVTVIGFVGLANLILPSVSEYAPGGGVLGDVVSSFFSGSFGTYLAGLLLLAFIVAGITLVTAMGWGQIIKLIAATSVAAVGFVQYLFKKERTAEQDIPADPTKHDIGYDPVFNEDNELPEDELTVEQDTTEEYYNARDDIEIHTNRHEQDEYYDEVADDETSHSVGFNADNSVVDPETAYQAEDSPQMYNDEADESVYDEYRETSQAYRYPDLANAAFIPLDVHYSNDDHSGMSDEQSYAEATEDFVEPEIEEITETTRETEELSEAAEIEGSDSEERSGKRAMSPLEFAAKFKGKPSKAPKADAYKKPRIKMTAAEIEHKAREQRAREEALRARAEATQSSNIPEQATSVNQQSNQQTADVASAINTDTESTQTESSTQSSASYGFTVPVQPGNVAVNFDELAQSDSPAEQPPVSEPTQTAVPEAPQTSPMPTAPPQPVQTVERVEPIVSEPQQPEPTTAVQPAPQTTAMQTEDGVAVGVVPQHKRPDFIRAENRNKLSNGQLPTVSLLDEAPEQELSEEVSEERLKEKSEQLEKLLASYNIEVIVRKVSAGPVITLYEIDPAPGVKVSQINNLSKDIARGLAVMGVRVLETIPGSTHVGIEVPNNKRMTVYLREVFESREFTKQKSPLTLVLGKDIGGKSVVANLAKMPHLLVAGTTGSGKSVAVNAMLLSILFKATPHDVRLIMIDPKMLELSIYDDIPHLLTPVVTDMKEAANSLRWCVTEMERRYKLLSALKVRNIASYNEVVKEAMERGEPILDPLYKMDPTAQLMEEAPPLEPLPFIVVVIDELADMMMVVGKKVEELIARLAQKARAAGIHLILATQRPSVDVITGLIKANVPTRIAFQVSSRIDSRTILDTQGAENLLGNGDMLYMPPGSGQPSRAHGAFVDDDEVVRVVDFLKSTGTPNYIQNITVNVEEEAEAAAAAEPANEQDELYDEAVAIVTTSRKATISFLQRQLRVGFNRAARLVEDMEAAGVVSTPDNGGTREVLAPPPTEL